MSQWLLIAAGGALGSVARHGFNLGVTRMMGNGFPWGILSVNVLGSFLIGAVAAGMLRVSGSNTALSPLFVTGFLGGFTTFSAFSLDVMKLVQAGQGSAAMTYVVASVGLSLLAVFMGFNLLRAALG